MDNEAKGVGSDCKVRRSGPNEVDNCRVINEHRSNIDGAHFARKRRRPRTKAFRMHIKDEIERALCSQDSPLQHIPLLVEPSGRMSASLNDVVAAVGLDGDKYRALSRMALAKLGHLSTLFSIDASNGAALRICLNVADTNFDAATVYLDNLPRDCDVVSLYRRATAFGTVVSLHPLFDHRRANNNNGNGYNNGSLCSDEQMPSTSTAQLPSVEQHVNAAFVQFVRPESAANFCEAYSKNWPIKHVYKRRKVRKAKRGLTGRRRDRALTENRTGHEVVAETKQSRKRKRVTSGRVSDEETPLKRSRSSFDIAGYAETVDGSKEEAHEDGQLQQMRDKNISNRADQESIRSGTVNVGVAHERKRRRRNKKRRGTKFKPKYRVINLTRYFRHMQVLSLKTFRDLRTKYLQLKRDNFKKLKADLRSDGVPLNTDNEGSKDRQKKRGRAKLMSRVAALREHYEQSLQVSPNPPDAVEEDADSYQGGCPRPDV